MFRGPRFGLWKKRPPGRGGHARGFREARPRAMGWVGMPGGPAGWMRKASLCTTSSGSGRPGTLRPTWWGSLTRPTEVGWRSMRLVRASPLVASRVAGRPAPRVRPQPDSVLVLPPVGPGVAVPTLIHARSFRSNTSLHRACVRHARSESTHARSRACLISCIPCWRRSSGTCSRCRCAP